MCLADAGWPGEEQHTQRPLRIVQASLERGDDARGGAAGALLTDHLLVKRAHDLFDVERQLVAKKKLRHAGLAHEERDRVGGAHAVVLLTRRSVNQIRDEGRRLPRKRVIRHEPREQAVDRFHMSALRIHLKVLPLCRRHLAQAIHGLSAREWGHRDDLKEVRQTRKQSPNRVEFGRRRLGDQAQFRSLQIGHEKRADRIARRAPAGAHQVQQVLRAEDAGDPGRLSNDRLGTLLPHA